jgi:hypothetical protein
MNFLKIRRLTMLLPVATVLLALPARAANWEMQAKCYFISADGKQQIENTCRVVGTSKDGMEGHKIFWEDGVETAVSGNFASGENYRVDGQPAIRRSVNNVSIYRTTSGNLIILHKI